MMSTSFDLLPHPRQPRGCYVKSSHGRLPCVFRAGLLQRHVNVGGSISITAFMGTMKVVMYASTCIGAWQCLGVLGCCVDACIVVTTPSCWGHTGSLRKLHVCCVTWLIT